MVETGAVNTGRMWEAMESNAPSSEQQVVNAPVSDYLAWAVALATAA